MHLSGQLADWSISDLLQIMQVTSKTGSLDIEAAQGGRVHFREGRVTGAELGGQSSARNGEDRSGIAEVLYVLSGFQSGRFAVGPADGPDIKGWDVDEIMSDVEVLRSLEGDLVDSGLIDASAIQLVDEIGHPLTIEPEDWHVILTFVQPFAFSALEEELGRGAAVRVLHTLDRLQLAQPVLVNQEPKTEPMTVESDQPDDPVEESEWLDRLADDMSPVAESPWKVADSEDGESSSDETDAEPVGEEDEGVFADEFEPHHPRHHEVTGLAAPASTTLTDGVYDEIRRLRSRVNDK